VGPPTHHTQRPQQQGSRAREGTVRIMGCCSRHRAGRQAAPSLVHSLTASLHLISCLIHQHLDHLSTHHTTRASQAHPPPGSSHGQAWGHDTRWTSPTPQQAGNSSASASTARRSSTRRSLTRTSISTTFWSPAPPTAALLVSFTVTTSHPARSRPDTTTPPHASPLPRPRPAHPLPATASPRQTHHRRPQLRRQAHPPHQLGPGSHQGPRLVRR